MDFILIIVLTIITLMTIGLVMALIGKLKWNAKVRYIENYHFPKLAVSKWRANYPRLDDEKAKLAQEALKQFFMIYVKSIKMDKKANFDMPSKIVDDLWHEFILCSREYHSFCQEAFGKYFHHSPHEPVKYTNLKGKKLSSGLLNTYRATSSYEKSAWIIGGVPLIFMIDEISNIHGGFLYDTNDIATQLAAAKSVGATSSGSNCGTYAMFGGCSSDGDSSSNSSCSSGCGGGGGCGD